LALLGAIIDGGGDFSESERLWQRAIAVNDKTCQRLIMISEASRQSAPLQRCPANPARHRGAQQQGPYAHYELFQRFFTLETESRLQFDHAAGETRGGLTEAGIPYVGAGTEETKRREIQLIEDIEEVRAQFDLRSFAEMREIRQAELLYHAHINGEVAWATE
jgi:hypothetical protein